MRRLLFLAALLGSTVIVTGCDDKPASGGGKASLQAPPVQTTGGAK